MSTQTQSGTAATEVKEEQPYVEPGRNRHTALWLLVIAAVWTVGYLLFKGQDTLARPVPSQLSSVDYWLNNVSEYIQGLSSTNWFFHGVLGGFANFLNSVLTWLQNMFSQPAPGRPTPEIGYLGTVALLTWIAYAVAGLRSALLVLAGVLLFGVLGFWEDSVDTLIVTVVAVVFCMVIGIPIGIWMARSKRVSAVITPVLDVMQTIPSMAYLIPFMIVFGIGAACAIVLTIVYAVPPLVRITEHGLRSVAESTQEAARSLGTTRWQLLRRVQLPMARRTIVVGINQSMMAALAMAIIATFVNGPGLGRDIRQALSTLNVGQGAVPGLLIVVIAIMLDRTTTAASNRLDDRRIATDRWRLVNRIVIGVGAVVVLVCFYLSHNYLGYAQFPQSLNFGAQVADAINSVSNAIVGAVDTTTLAFKNFISYGFLNPLQELLANTPWWLMALLLLAFAFVVGGFMTLVATAVCGALFLALDMWNDAMITLTTTVVATVLVMAVALVIGVWIGRSRRADLVIRPILDTFQTIPPFVYLIPALALFGASRLTAIVAGVGYAFPTATKLVADGIRGVSGTTVEAAESTGVTRGQMIRKVQLPMARSAIVLATNQGLLYVLSMVAIGGLVGGGSLGFLVNQGFVQINTQGKGLAASAAITVLGIMLDRMARGAAARGSR